MFFIDPMYLVFVGPAILLAMWAQHKVKSAFKEASELPSRSGMTGAEAARRVLDQAGLSSVQIEPSKGGSLSDHYDPREKVLRLSEGVYGTRSLAAIGIAAHEAGHAVQDAQNYSPLVIRNGMVPFAATGSQLSMILVVGGLLFSFLLGMTEFGGLLLLGGIALYTLVVVFQLINLPVEFNASSRAKEVIQDVGVVSSDEMQPINRVLGAAAMTYVAATLTAVMTLVWLLYMFLGGEQ